jgi:hypothetical protein
MDLEGSNHGLIRVQEGQDNDKTVRLIDVADVIPTKHLQEYKFKVLHLDQSVWCVCFFPLVRVYLLSFTRECYVWLMFPSADPSDCKNPSCNLFSL